MNDQPEPTFESLVAEVGVTMPTIFADYMRARFDGDAEAMHRALCKLTRAQGIGMIVVLANGFQEMFKSSIEEMERHMRCHGENPRQHFTRAGQWAETVAQMCDHAEDVTKNRHVEKMLKEHGQ